VKMALFDKFFGFTFKKKTDKKEKASFVFPANTDGAVLVETQGGMGGWNAYVDLDGALRDEYQMVSRYRDMTLQPEVDQAVNHIINDAIVQNPGEPTIEIILDQTELSDNIKDSIREQFEHICKLLDFNNQAYDIFRRWYVDGRLYYHCKLDEKNPRKQGISELQYIDPRQIKKVREIEIRRNNEMGVDEVLEVDDYYIYAQQGFFNTNSLTSDQGMSGYGSGAGRSSFPDNNTLTVNRSAGHTAPQMQGALKLSSDSVVFTHSNLMDPTCRHVLSHLHKAIRFVNLMRMLEDAIIIYRIARAPERRVFYIDTDGLPPKKAEAHVREVMNSYRNQTTYDAVTGEVREDKRHLSMLDDFWLPRRNTGSGTEVQNLSGGQNLGQIDDLDYFQNKLYEALQVPVSRFARADKSFSLGRTNEITQDELQFSRYITRLRSRFADLFDELLGKQLVLTKTLSSEEWEDIKDQVYYEFNSDSHFAELKNAELLTERFRLLRDVKEFEGELISRKFIQENILQMSEEEIDEMAKQIAKEKEETREEKLERAELASEIQDIINVNELPDYHRGRDDQDELSKSIDKVDQVTDVDDDVDV